MFPPLFPNSLFMGKGEVGIPRRGEAKNFPRSLPFAFGRWLDSKKQLLPFSCRETSNFKAHFTLIDRQMQ